MCDYVMRQEPTHNVYCSRASQFWVQSLLSTHNSLTCAHHLARTVRSIEAEAKKFDLCVLSEDPDLRYLKTDAKGHPARRTTQEAANYARVTVKPYTTSKRRRND